MLLLTGGVISLKLISASAPQLLTIEDDIVELEMSSSMAKAYCSDVFNKVSGDNIQVHGGIGFTWEHPAHLYFKKAKSDSLIFGTAKSARNDVSRLLSL